MEKFTDEQLEACSKESVEMIKAVTESYRHMMQTKCTAHDFEWSREKERFVCKYCGADVSADFVAGYQCGTDDALQRIVNQMSENGGVKHD